MGLLLRRCAKEKGKGKQSPHQEEKEEADLALIGNLARRVVPQKKTSKKLLKLVSTLGTGNLLLQSLGNAASKEQGRTVVLR
ncbi:hypothetical protein [Thermus albus]|uniref:hypothetical protein n=1 Tax=Thermus albus TaxID=2908146 RepID=UPI001FAA0B37|nr:hypothetical protein [Thermus albus]